MGRLSDFFTKLFRRQRALPEAELEENELQSGATTNVTEIKEENTMNEHEAFIAEQKEKDRVRRLEEWKNMSKDDKILFILEKQGVDKRILENPMGKQLLVNWVRATIEGERDFDDYNDVSSSINLDIKDGKVQDKVGIRKRGGKLGGQDLSMREMFINENGMLEVQTICEEVDIPYHRTNGGMGVIDQYLESKTYRKNVYDRNGLEEYQEYIDAEKVYDAKTKNPILNRPPHASAYTLKRGNNEYNLAVAEYTVYENIVPGDAMSGKIHSGAYTKSMATQIDVSSQYPNELGGKRLDYEQLKEEINNLENDPSVIENGHAFDKGYAIAYSEQGKQNMAQSILERTKEMAQNSPIIKKALDKKIGQEFDD